MNRRDKLNECVKLTRKENEEKEKGGKEGVRDKGSESHKKGR